MTDPQSRPVTQRPIWQLVVGFAVIVAVLGWWGGWPLPFVIFSIILMVVFHELGHLVTARLTGMKASEFFVGFGPRLWSKKVGETEWGIKAYPLGGYVKILGMSSLEEVEPGDEAKTFRAATYPRKVLVASAGSLMHLLLALILIWASLTFFGRPTSYQTSIGKFTQFVGVSQNAAQRAGFQKGDLVIEINGQRLLSATSFSDQVSAASGHTLTFVVLRKGRQVTLHATPVDGRTLFVSDHSKVSPVIDPKMAAKGFLGVTINQIAVLTRESAFAAVPGAFSEVGNLVGQTAVSVGKIFSPGGISGLFQLVTNSRVANQSVANPTTGPVRPTSIFGAAHYAIQVARSDPAGLLILFAAINIGIGLINMLPMLPLDGGHVAVATYERLRSRRGRARYVADVTKLMPVVYAFLAILLMVFASALFLDITHPINF